MNKMVKIIAIVALTAAFSLAQGDGDLKFGVRAGFNLHQIEYDVFDLTIGMGFGAGLTASIPLTNTLVLNPELGFSYKKLPFIDEDEYEMGITEFAINIPVLFQYELSGPHSGALGVQLDIPFSSEAYIKSDGQEETMKAENRAALDFSFVARYGYMLSQNIRFDIRAARALTSVDKDNKGIVYSQSVGMSYIF